MALSPTAMAIIARAANRPAPASGGTNGPGVPYIPVKAQADIRSVDAGTGQKVASTTYTGVRTKGEIQKQKDADDARRAAQDALYTMRIRYRDNMQIASQAISTIRRLAGSNTAAGYGALMSTLPDNNARELANAVKTLTSLNFAGITGEIKRENPKGATIVSRLMKAEIPLLTNEYGVLDPKSPDSLLNAVNNADFKQRSQFAGVNGDAPLLNSSDENVRKAARTNYGIVEPGQPMRGWAPVPKPNVPEDMLRTAGGGAALTGGPQSGLLKAGETQSSVPVSPDYQSDHKEYVDGQLSEYGYIDPDAYAAWRATRDKQEGWGVQDPQLYKDYAKAASDAYKKGRTVGSDIPNVNTKASDYAQIRAEAEANPIVSGAESVLAGATSTFAKPFMSRDAQDRMELMRQQNSKLAATGEIADFIGTPMLNAAFAAKYGLPALSPIIANTAHSALATYDPEHPVGSTLFGGTVGALTEGGTGIAGRALTGVEGLPGEAPSLINIKMPESIQNLVNQWNPTTGERAGGWGKRLEDFLAKTPIAGATLRARQAEGAGALDAAKQQVQGAYDKSLAGLTSKYADLSQAAKDKAAAEEAARISEQAQSTSKGEDWAYSQTRAQQLEHETAQNDAILGLNRSVTQQVADAVDATHSGVVGHAGVNEAADIMQNAYRTALGDVKAPPTAEFSATVEDAVKRLEDSGADQSTVTNLRRKIAPYLDKDYITGQDYQALLRKLRDARGSAGADVSDVTAATDTIEQALHDMVSAAAPDAKAALDKANAARRLLGPIEIAANNSIENGGVFTPKTFLDATVESGRRFEGVPGLARRGPDIPLVDTAVAAHNGFNDLLASQEAEQARLSRVISGKAEGLDIEQEAANKAAAEKAATLSDYIDTRLSRGKAALETGRDTAASKLDEVYGALRNAPSKPVSLGKIAAIGGPLALADIGTEQVTGDEGAGLSAAGRDALILAGLGIAPNLMYSKLFQKAMTREAPSALLSRYLPAALSGGARALTTPSANTKLNLAPEDIPSSFQFQLPRANSAANVAIDVTPVTQNDGNPDQPMEDDGTIKEARGGRINKRFSVKKKKKKR